MKINKHLWAIIIFNVVYLLIFTIYYISISNFEFLIYIGVLLAVSLLVFFTLKKTNFDYLVLWLLSVWGLVHMIAGGVNFRGDSVYALRIFPIFDGGGDFFILKMDQVIHAYGFFTCAILIYALTKKYFVGKSGRFLPVFIAWLGSMGLGALNEVVEFIAFVIVKETGVGGVYNTGLDLIFNLFGALIGALFAAKIYWKD